MAGYVRPSASCTIHAVHKHAPSISLPPCVPFFKGESCCPDALNAALHHTPLGLCAHFQAHSQHAHSQHAHSQHAHSQHAHSQHAHSQHAHSQHAHTNWLAHTLKRHTSADTLDVGALQIPALPLHMHTHIHAHTHTCPRPPARAPLAQVTALDKLGVGSGCRSFLDVGCGTGYVSALAACLLGGDTVEQNCSVHALECASSRLECARANLRTLREHLAGPQAPDVKVRCLSGGQRWVLLVFVHV